MCGALPTSCNLMACASENFTFYVLSLLYVGRDSAVGIVTCYGLDGPGIESW